MLVMHQTTCCASDSVFADPACPMYVWVPRCQLCGAEGWHAQTAIASACRTSWQAASGQLPRLRLAWATTSSLGAFCLALLQVAS